MKPTNVVSLDFTSAETMEKFIKMYERDAPSLYSEAELLVLVKTEEASLIAIAAYSTEEDRLAAKPHKNVLAATLLLCLKKVLGCWAI